MTKNVLLSISGLHTDVYEEGERDEPIEIISPATYYLKDGLHYVFYEEIAQDSRRVTKNRITISPNRVEIQKQGEANYHMLFEKGVRNIGLYETYMGAVKVGVFTKKIELTESINDIFIRLEYALDLNAEPVETCIVLMHIKAKEEKR